MAQYDHLPIFRASYDLALAIDKTVHGWSRYHKYAVGTEIREVSRLVLMHIVRANNQQEVAMRLDMLHQTSDQVELLKILLRLAYDSDACASRKQYLHLSQQVVAVRKQLHGWLRYTGDSDTTS